MRSVAVAMLCALFWLPALPAGAEPARYVSSRLAVAPAQEQVGCYWYRQRQYCSRYCYWEVNGRRYCREREREAYSQAPVVDAVPFVVMPAPMKLGGPDSRGAR